MGLTDAEKASINQEDASQSLLAPFQRILESWTVAQGSRFKQKISQLELSASGDLESDWSIQVKTKGEGVLVAEFTFPEYGRFFDMRRLIYSQPPPIDPLETWVKHKVDQGRIKYSALAQRLGVSFSDPRVIHDIAYRVARSNKFELPRRRWYNNQKEAGIRDLYKQLQEAMAEAMGGSIKADFRRAAPRNRSRVRPAYAGQGTRGIFGLRPRD